MEFLACKPEVETLLERGYTVRMVFDELASKGRIGMSYCQFSKYVKNREHQPTTGSLGAPAASPSLPARREPLPLAPMAGQPVKGTVPRLADGKLPATDTQDIEKLLARTEA